jgi:hypothetical protein
MADEVSETDNQVHDAQTRGTCSNTQYNYVEGSSNGNRLASFGQD